MNQTDIQSESFEGGLVLRVIGPATFAAADSMRMAVTRAIAARPAKAIVDLSQSTDISSLFAGQLMALHNGLRHHAGQACVAGASPRVREALDRMRVTQVLSVFDTVEAAKG
jgi:anti-anti-sigma regulatory factor